MKWHNREKKLKQKRSQKNMGKPFKRTTTKDSSIEKKLSKVRKKLKQVEQQAEMEDDVDYENY